MQLNKQTKLITMQKLEPRTDGLKPANIGHLDRVYVFKHIVYAVQQRCIEKKINDKS